MAEPLDSIHAAIGDELPSALQGAAIEAADRAYTEACEMKLTFPDGVRFVMRAIAEAVAIKE